MPFHCEHGTPFLSRKEASQRSVTSGGLNILRSEFTKFSWSNNNRYCLCECLSNRSERAVFAKNKFKLSHSRPAFSSSWGRASEASYENLIIACASMCGVCTCRCWLCARVHVCACACVSAVLGQTRVHVLQYHGAQFRRRVWLEGASVLVGVLCLYILVFSL